MTFSQCVHGVYDEKMEAVYRKYSQNYSFKEDSESTYTIKGENMDNNQSNYENKNEFGQNPYPQGVGQQVNYQQNSGQQMNYQQNNGQQMNYQQNSGQQAN